MPAQQPRFDTDAIKRAFTVSSIVGEYVALTRVGNEFVGLCPFHGETTPSFKVNDQKRFYHCFGCGQSGDVIDFYAAMTRTDPVDAMKALANRAGISPEAVSAGRPVLALVPPTPKAAPEPEPDDPSHAPLSPVPDDAPPARFQHGTRGAPVATWTYRDGAGRLLGYVCRFEQDGHKDILPLVFTAGRKWRWAAFGKPRPLYGLPALAARPGAPVLVVEGEKAADAAARLVPAMVAVSWPGGGKAVQHTDWRPLAGRRVMIWPDWDLQPYPPRHALAGQRMPREEQPGIVAGKAIAAALEGIAATVRIAEYQADITINGFDAADALAAGWTEAQAMSFLKASSAAPAAALPTRADHEPPPLTDDDMGDIIGDDVPHRPAATDGDAPFLYLGHDHGDYFYLAKGARQVMRISGPGHTKGALMMLAPLAWWEQTFESSSKTSSFNVDMAANAMIRRSEQVGIYDPMRVRGRGAWFDDGAAVLHLGDRLVTGGREFDLSAAPASRYIYEAAPPLHVQIDNPLASRDARELEALCRLLSWERPIHARLLAGWCVVAPICGALRWRPHIWLTGPAGSGKTWVYKYILQRCLGDMALAAASETTEAGLRQTLGSDARPVIFDEAEGETPKSQARIQNVMALMRQSSSETSAMILKGTTDGGGQMFRPRSCFAFASIGIGVQQHADQTRVTVLTMTIDRTQTEEQRAANFAGIEQKWQETLTPDFISRLHARTVSMIPVIRENAEIFALAGASIIGTRRSGDQIGALLAGAYALYRDNVITVAEARAWLLSQDWTEESSVSDEKDEASCLRTIMQHVIPVQVQVGSAGNVRHDRGVGELISIAAGFGASAPVSISDAADALERIGIYVDFDSKIVRVANHHTGISRILQNTPWANNWGETLKRLPGARRGAGRRFQGATVRTTDISVDDLLGKGDLE